MFKINMCFKIINMCYLTRVLSTGAHTLIIASITCMHNCSAYFGSLAYVYRPGSYSIKN